MLLLLRNTATTWNPADKSSRITLSGGDLTATIDASGTYSFLRSTNPKTAGKLYYEATDVAAGGFVGAGFADASQTIADNTYLGGSTASIGYHSNGNIDLNGSTSSTVATYTTGDVIGCAIDFAARLVWFSKNGTWQNGNPSAGTGGTSLSAIGSTIYPAGDAQTSGSITANFGASTFAYTPPTGYVGWDTAAASYTLSAATGSFALTGTAATFKAGRKLTAASGSYALTGTAATLRKGFRLTAASGSYALTGTAATFKRGLRLVAGTGAFTLSGSAASLKAGRRLTAASGAYVLSGTSASLLTARKLSAGSAAFTLAGSAASLRAARVLVASSGNYTLTGTNADLRYAAAARIAAETGAFVLQGGVANFIWRRVWRTTPVSPPAAWNTVQLASGPSLGFTLAAPASVWVVTPTPASSPFQTDTLAAPGQWETHT